MPELPEVETVRRGLSERIIGLCIRKVEVFCEKSFVGKTSEVEGRKVVGLRRFGKALIIDLSGGKSMMVHLRMTGQLIFDGVGREPEEKDGAGLQKGGASVRGEDAAGLEEVDFEGRKRYAAGHPSENFVAKLPNKQTRVVFYFDRGMAGKSGTEGVDDDFGDSCDDDEARNAGILYFNDQRKFGFVKVLATDEVEREPFVAKLAKEPWEMTEEEFYAALQRHKGAPIKAVILDQGVIAGLGNIYADESLFMSGIHPERRAGSVSREEAGKLLRAAREVMTRSIESGGSTMATYVKTDGTRGNYLEKFAQVFRKEGQACPKCGAEIVKIRVAGRGTHICPECQKVEPAEGGTQESERREVRKGGGTRKRGVGQVKSGVHKEAAGEGERD